MNPAWTAWALALHLVAAGLWLGCVLTEVLFERTLARQGPDAERLLARLHWRVDLGVEVPAMVLMLITGLALWPVGRVLPGWLGPKLALAAAAWLANAWCVWLVWRRRRAADAGDRAAFAALDRQQHRWGALVLLGLVGALILGVHHHAWP